MDKASKGPITEQQVLELQKSAQLQPQLPLSWRVAMNGQIMPSAIEDHQIRDWVAQQPKGSVLVWKPGMDHWKSAEDLFAPPEKQFRVGFDGVLQTGTLSEKEIRQRMEKDPNMDIQVWREGMESWKKAFEFFPKLEPSFRFAVNKKLQAGEIREKELKEMLAKDPHMDIQVWREGMDGWKKAKDLVGTKAVDWSVVVNGKMEPFKVSQENLASWLSKNKGSSIHLWRPGMDRWQKPEELFDMGQAIRSTPQMPMAQNKSH